MSQTRKRRFSSILVSAPIVPPFPESDYGQMKIYYDAARCLELEDLTAWQHLNQDLLDAAAAMAQEGADATEALKAAGGDEAPPDVVASYTARMTELTKGVEAITRQTWVKVLTYTVERIEWPFDDPVPNPHKADSWEPFAAPVLDWLAGPALGEVRAQVRSPKSAASLSPPRS